MNFIFDFFDFFEDFKDKIKQKRRQNGLFVKDI